MRAAPVLPRSTHQRVGLILLIAVVICSALLAAVLGGVVFPTFRAIEHRDAIRNIDRVAQAIRRELEFIATTCRDWAHWDDTYQYALDGNAEFYHGNLTADATANVPADLIAVFGADGQPRMQGAYRALSAQADQALAALTAEGDLFRYVVQPLLGPAADAERHVSAILRLQGRPLLAVGQPILRSDRSGPAVGVLVMAALFDADDQAALQAQTLVDFDLYDASSAPEPHVPPAERFSSQHGDEGRIEVVDRDWLRLSVRFRTADGGVLVALSNYPRQMTAQGSRALALALAISAGCFAVVVAVIYRVLLVRSFLDPLRQVGGQLRRIEHARDVAARLPEDRGAAELRELAGAFNRMMVELQAQRDEVAALSLTDALTGLANRRQFDQVFEREFAHAQRQPAALALLLLDVDHFKPFNDHYGHPAGDACLRQLADALGATLTRGTDLLCRYGGEEFAVVLPGADAGAAERAAEAVLEAIRALAIEHRWRGDGGDRVTVSIGWQAGVPTTQQRPADWLALADAALYRAKDQGRNCQVGAAANR